MRARPSDFPAGDGVFLRLGAADRASCVMVFTGSAHSFRPLRRVGAGREPWFLGQRYLGHLYTQNPAFRQWGSRFGAYPRCLPADFP